MLLHVTGASGSGTTTLGAALASDFALSHLDGDDYYWIPTVPPFQQKRSSAERLAMLRSDIESSGGAVVSGSLVGWGAEVENVFDLVVFLYLPTEIRIERLQRRESQRYGRVNQEFLTWAAQYDDGPPEGRSLKMHEVWLGTRTCPVLRLTQDQSVPQRVAEVRRCLTTRSS
ncbi:MAG: hypothetical protein FJX57_00950 [Alphaproteobacteria bacterium]|nr:hypothetical protein [Alphaproteobacteria bacterium]